MRAMQIVNGFGLSSLTPVELEEPPLGAREVRVRVRAVSLNYRDLLMVRGEYDPKQPLPLVPCSDGAGEVIEVGPGVTRWKIGDRVLGSFAQKWIAGAPSTAKLRSTLGGPLPGMLQETRVHDEEGLWPCPAHLSFEEGATLPCAALTAWHALVDHGRLAAGQRVLVQGTGGVSIFALQIARLFGAEVIATSSKADKRARLEKLGASHVLDYVADRDWGRSVKKIAANVGVDHVVEVGGAGTMAQSLRAVAPGGIVHVIGILAGASEPLSVLPILMNEVRLSGTMVGPRESAEAMGRAFSLAGLRPVIDTVFPFEEARAAFEHLASGAHFGKVVIAV
ncbi:MAG: NAD(P)-dependent alcohol dehydrogenase [Sandaracinaceae bacterium]